MPRKAVHAGTLGVVTGCAKRGIVAGPPRQRRKLLGLRFACLISFRLSETITRGSPHMSTADGRQPTMDATQIYREDTFTDRKVGTIRRLTPVAADGTEDSARPVIFVGQAQVMTPMG